MREYNRNIGVKKSFRKKRERMRASHLLTGQSKGSDVRCLLTEELNHDPEGFLPRYSSNSNPFPASKICYRVAETIRSEASGKAHLGDQAISMSQGQTSEGRVCSQEEILMFLKQMEKKKAGAKEQTYRLKQIRRESRRDYVQTVLT